MQSTDKGSKKYKDAKKLRKNLLAAKAVLVANNATEPSSDSSDETTSDEDEADDDGEEDAVEATTAVTKRKKVQEEQAEEQGEEASSSKKSKKTAKKSKSDEPELSPKKRKVDNTQEEQVEVEKKGDCITKHYAPSDSSDEMHKYYFKGPIGGGYHVAFCQWLKNKQNYIQIRKSSAIGANIPAQFYANLKAAVNDVGVGAAFVKKVTHAFIPFRGSSEAAGFDLLSCHSVDILAGTTGCINTGIQVVLPKNTYGRIADRSSMAIKSLAVLGGVIDRDYTGSIIIMLHNFGRETLCIQPGDRVAQLIVERIYSGEASVLMNGNSLLRVE
ncbi:Deoxyuridine 5'-triphosphate nucleotidohydrolase [Orchesella cincta]|uniref:Deoxyuridine 5'-triphosphate nucleotidohydrolase n=1 Tax=Orchesella cincta TaxID=48709 RepID=A0A1D2M9A3_ORCCI|nr:Deoxyuridine 5'-triphosphate nucleotidohydrolase [Orchesella cincta]